MKDLLEYIGLAVVIITIALAPGSCALMNEKANEQQIKNEILKQQVEQPK